LPPSVAAASPYLPTRQLADLLDGIVAGNAWAPRPWLVLLGFAVVLGIAAVVGYRRDEGQRFR
jgi:hypothetical protein